MMFTRDLRQPVYVGFAGAEVAALDGVVEEAINAIAVVLVVFCRVDAALRGDGMGAPGRILETKALNVVSELGKRRCGGSAGKSRADDEDGVFALVRRIYELQFEARAIPSCLNRTGRDSGIERHTRSSPAGCRQEWQSERR